MLWPVLKQFLFRMEAERAHEFGIEQLVRLQSHPRLLDVAAAIATPRNEPESLFGLSFRNPIGLAAGFDKNAVAIEALQALGFGFLEIGTVTPKSQSGNPRPRMFRYPAQRALINRLGFNNDGAAAVRSRLESLRSRSAIRVPLFVNIGKNRDVALEDAPRDYTSCYEMLAPLADAIVVNISSPNTPGLRDLQTPEHLTRLFEMIGEKRDSLALGRQPILLKIAPDLEDEDLEKLLTTARTLVDGITATNTTVDRSGLPAAAERQGGVSGAPLFERSSHVLQKVRRFVGDAMPVIGVGGILTARDVEKKLAAGADLVQLYTGFVYEGPFVVRKLMRGLPGFDRSLKARP
jgi:dihydroorotate dehydrogenase